MSDHRRHTAKAVWGALQARANDAALQRKFGFMECIGEALALNMLDREDADYLMQRFSVSDIDAFAEDQARGEVLKKLPDKVSNKPVMGRELCTSFK
jgi:hypothetical protein